MEDTKNTKVAQRECCENDGVDRAVMNRRLRAFEIVAVIVTVTGALALLSQLEIVSNAAIRVDVAVVVVFLASFYALVRDWRLGLGVLGAAVLLYLVAVVLPIGLAVAALAGGAAVLLIGRLVKRA